MRCHQARRPLPHSGQRNNHQIPGASRGEAGGAAAAAYHRAKLSVILNVLLAGAIIAMFYISYVSEQPNVINYERALTSKYASWEQELTEREQVIRETERELKINQD